MGNLSSASVDDIVTNDHISRADARELTASSSVRAVYVYQAPVRIWHWINAAAITVLAVTGYLIGSPLPSLGGEPSSHFLMGYIRFAHFSSGYILLVGLIGRIYWAFVGNHHAREIFTLPVFDRHHWAGLVQMLKWYSFLVPRPGQYVGHNPMARTAMFAGFFLFSLFMIATGFAMYGEGSGPGSWAHAVFSSWVIPLFGQSQNVHTWHHLGMWAMVIFVMLHVYAAIREDIMGRQSMLSTMISGVRTFKE